MTDLILHEYAPSGNCYKIRLTAAHRRHARSSGANMTSWRARRGRRSFWRASTPTGASRCCRSATDFCPKATPLASISPTARALIPADAFDRADMLRWMFWEQYNHEPNVATLRFWYGWIGEDESSPTCQRAHAAGQARGGRRRAGADGRASARTRDWFVGGPPHASPTSRSTPTRMSPRRAGSSCRAIRRCRRGWRGSRRMPGHIAIDA